MSHGRNAMTETLTAESPVERHRPPHPGQRAAHAGGRCGREGQVRPSRHAHGHGGYRRGAVEPPSWHNPADPHWPDRDRFVLSNGHGSMLLYGLLHLTGYDLPLEELKRFRQLHSRTARPSGMGHHAGRRDDHRARSARASPTRSAWRWPNGCWPRIQRPGSVVDHRTFVVPRRRLPDGRHLPRGLLARRHAGAGKAGRRSTTTTASRSTAMSRAGSPTTRRSGSKPTAGG